MSCVDGQLADYLVAIKLPTIHGNSMSETGIRLSEVTVCIYVCLYVQM